MAGVLVHLPALVALTCPSFNSYERLRPGAWAGSTVSWGIDNRECTVRVASPFRGREDGVDQRGAQGLRPELQPVPGARRASSSPASTGSGAACEPPEPARHDPARMTAEERERCGIRPLPGSLREALATLQADPVLFPALGDLLGRCIIAVRTAEAEALER